MSLLIGTGWRRAQLCGFQGLGIRRAQSFALRQPTGVVQGGGLDTLSVAANSPLTVMNINPFIFYNIPALAG
jgi:hypothetical protein